MNELLRAAVCRLDGAGVGSPALDARILLAEALGTDRAGLADRRDDVVEAPARARFHEFLDRRAEREPVSRIIGRREFWSLELLISEAVLDPRPDSEAVVEAALGAVKDRGAPLRVLDLGTGSGCLLLALLHELRAARGVGTDRSPAAAALAAANARRLGLGHRAAFLVSDWAAALAATFDLIVANPPYISSADLDALEPEVRLHDPRPALDGGADGIDAYRRLAPRLATLLAPAGVAALEISADQADSVGELLAAEALRVDALGRDLSGSPRALVVRHDAR